MKRQTFKVTDSRRSKSDIFNNKQDGPYPAQELKELAKKAQEQNYIVPIKPKGARVLVRNDETPEVYGSVIIPNDDVALLE